MDYISQEELCDCACLIKPTAYDVFAYECMRSQYYQEYMFLVLRAGRVNFVINI